MKMLLTDEEFRVLTMFRALTPDKQAEFLDFQRALNRGDMETCRRFCAGMFLMCLTPFWRVRGLAKKTIDRAQKNASRRQRIEMEAFRRTASEKATRESGSCWRC